MCIHILTISELYIFTNNFISTVEGEEEGIIVRMKDLVHERP